MKSATHNNLTCTFSERGHVYKIKDTGQRLISGTTFIKKFFKPFDAVAVSEKIADKRGTTPQALRHEWKQMGAQASKDGDAVHAYIEWLTTGRGVTPLSINNDRVHNLKKQAKRAVVRLRNAGMIVIDAEMIIFSAGLGLAGQIDCVAKNSKGYYIIIDWKTNKELKTENGWEQGLSPLGHLDNCNMNHYKLQLSLYHYILQSEGYFPGAKGFKRVIVHLTEDGVTLNKVPYMRDEIKGMLI